jgi:tetratricopeptide (TPR) repeat protein
MKDVPHTEVLTYSFPDMGNDYAVAQLAWEKKAIPFKIEVDVHKVVLANFRNELRNLPGFGWQGFQTAANYCLNNNINNSEALQWANTAVQRNKNFNTLSTQAGLMFQGGKQAEGDAVLDQAVKLATRAQINAVGYQLLGQKRFKKAIEILALNTASDPTDANAFDSLGEAYKLAGDKPNAVKNLRKALTLNPAANVKSNSEKLLKELGETIE